MIPKKVTPKKVTLWNLVPRCFKRFRLASCALEWSMWSSPSGFLRASSNAVTSGTGANDAHLIMVPLSTTNDIKWQTKTSWKCLDFEDLWSLNQAFNLLSCSLHVFWQFLTYFDAWWALHPVGGCCLWWTPQVLQDVRPHGGVAPQHLATALLVQCGALQVAIRNCGIAVSGREQIWRKVQDPFDIVCSGQGGLGILGSQISELHASQIQSFNLRSRQQWVYIIIYLPVNIVVHVVRIE